VQQDPEQAQPNPVVSGPPDSGPFASAPSAEASAPVPPSGEIRRKSFLSTALPLAFLSSVVCLWSLFLGWLVLVATVVWATLRHQRQQIGHVSAGKGARLGSLMGFFAFLFFLLFTLVTFLLGDVNTLRAEMTKQIQQATPPNPDPRVLEMLHWFTTGQGMAFLVGFGLFVSFIFVLVSATAAGAVAGAVYSKKPEK
jgi:hypothetical protein